MTLELQCRCGEVRLRHTGPHLRHFDCFCRHCQRSMAWIEAQGGSCSRSAAGGDQTLMVYSDGLELLAGAAQLGVYSVVERVRTPRVYARCCHTAIASTFRASGLYTALKTVAVRNPEVLPPLREHINVASAPADARFTEDGLSCYRGLGPLVGQLLWGMRPGTGHRSKYWAPWSVDTIVHLSP